MLDKELESLIGDDGEKIPGLGVIVFKDGKKVYEKFFGRRNLEKNLPVTRDTKFRVASVSKMFTIFSVMQLVEQGKINLDEDVENYLGFKLRNPNFPQEKITVRMLASHTSTLRDGKIYSTAPKFSLAEFFKPNGLFFDNAVHFGREDKNFFSYCNLNFGILGTIIEKVTGERFDVYQKKNIFSPLEISADYVVGNFDRKNLKNLGTLYQKNNCGVWDEHGEWFAKMDDYKFPPKKNFVLLQNPYDESGGLFYGLKNYKVGTNATIFSPQGGLRISFGELANCLEMILSGGSFHGKKIIYEDSLKEMCRPQWIFDEKIKNGETSGVMFNYCLGLYRIDGAGRARLCKDKEINFIGHSGEAYGMISGFYFCPEKNFGVIFMANGTAIEPGKDKKSFGKFGNSFIWEEKIMNPVCKFIF